jgi:hypothetical protein
MVQTDDLLVLAFIFGLLALLLYSLYFRISRKYFAQSLSFNTYIKANDKSVPAEILGKGIMNKIIIKTVDSNFLVDFIIDSQNFQIVKFENGSKKDLDYSKELIYETEAEKAFKHAFSISVNNLMDQPIVFNGTIFYEIKKPVSESFRALIQELR